MTAQKNPRSSTGSRCGSYARAPTDAPMTPDRLPQQQAQPPPHPLHPSPSTPPPHTPRPPAYFLLSTTPRPPKTMTAQKNPRSSTGSRCGSYARAPTDDPMTAERLHQQQQQPPPHLPFLHPPTSA